jgi:small ubiquitin-related modifier
VLVQRRAFAGAGHPIAALAVSWFLTDTPLLPSAAAPIAEKVFKAYAERKGVNEASMRFVLDGDVVKGDQTPKMLELEDGDQIDCMLEQVGGSD